MAYMNVSLDSINILLGISEKSDSAQSVIDGLISSHNYFIIHILLAFTPIGGALGAFGSSLLLSVVSRK